MSARGNTITQGTKLILYPVKFTNQLFRRLIIIVGPINPCPVTRTAQMYIANHRHERILNII